MTPTVEVVWSNVSSNQVNRNGCDLLLLAKRTTGTHLTREDKRVYLLNGGRVTAILPVGRGYEELVSRKTWPTHWALAAIRCCWSAHTRRLCGLARVERCGERNAIRGWSRARQV